MMRMLYSLLTLLFFFFNDTATTEIYTLSLHDALPISAKQQGAAVIRLGIVGCNYGRTVQLPAFRLDPRCQVVALAGSDAARTAELAKQAEVPEAFGDWMQMIESANIDAIAIAVPPRLQPEIAIAALQRGKPVFVEKPLAADLASARAMVDAAGG